MPHGLYCTKICCQQYLVLSHYCIWNSNFKSVEHTFLLFEALFFLIKSRSFPGSWQSKVPLIVCSTDKKFLGLEWCGVILLRWVQILLRSCHPTQSLKGPRLQLIQLVFHKTTKNA